MEPDLADNYEYVMHGKMFQVNWCRGQNWVKTEVLNEQGEKVTKWICEKSCGCDGYIHNKFQDTFVVISSSFGGLLMRLVGEERHLTGLYKDPDQRLYLLLKKQ